MKKSIGAKSIIQPNPVLIVCTYDSSGNANAMAVAWGGICCSKPPSVSISLRKATYTHGNISERKAFTVNVPSEDLARESDYFGIVSGRDTDKFADTGLTAVRSEIVEAPYIDEFPFVLECNLTHTVEIGLHTQFIGEIMDVKAEEAVLDEKGRVDIKKVNPFIYEREQRADYGIGDFIGKAYTIGKDKK